MRIAQLANFVGPSSGGMKTALRALGTGYVRSGAARLLVVPGHRDRRYETEAGTVVQLRGPRVGGGYRVIVEPRRVVEVLQEFAPTSLEVSDKSTMLPVAAWARQHGVPALLLSHERLDAMLGLRTGWPFSFGASTATLNRALVRRFDGVVVTSRFAAAEFDAPARAAGTPVHRVPLGVDLDTFRPPATPGGEGPGEPVRLVHAGRLSREKSPDLAVATALALHRRGVPVLLDVYGDGPWRRRLEAMAAGAPVTFHGHLAGRGALSRALAAADVALSVCPGETFGLAVLEALASGTPVVTAAEGGARELVDGASGAWAPADPVLLGDAVLRVLDRPVAARRRAARRRAEQFSWSRSVLSMLDLHAGLAGVAPSRTA
ncbi:glycosyltransferase [Nocardioides solisilvae]|uniref:glycosyltransferase n=1 Tax=Nocardioides solisilvae TaxID=1542435 RepID=UPI000D74BCEF|nr:glycosyltransferase [Nocardioides solisilvae]